MVKSFPANSLNICGPTFFGYLFVGRRFGCLPTQSQHRPQPHPGRWCVYRLGYLLVCGRMGLALGLRRGSALVYLCSYFLSLQLYTAGMRDGAPHRGFCSSKRLRCLLILSPFLAVSILRKLSRYSSSRSGWSTGKCSFSNLSFREDCTESERMKCSFGTFSFPMIISILFKFIGLWGICSVWVGSKLYAGITGRKAQGNLKCASRA